MARKKNTTTAWVAGAQQAQRNLTQGAKLATGAGKVFAARTCRKPVDITETARMIPEKAIAFGAAGLLSLQYAQQLGGRMAALGSDEAAHTRRHMRALARAHPATIAAVLTRGVWDFWQRAATQNLVLASAVMRAQHAATVPMARAVARNNRRLNKSR